MNIDPISIDLWRSEALIALSVSEKFASHQIEATVRITKEAEAFLKSLLPVMTEGGMKVFHQDVTEAAVSLASIIRCSTTSYYLSFATYRDPDTIDGLSFLTDAQGDRLHRSDLDRFKIRDIRSRKPLKPGPAFKAMGENVTGEQILLVQPGLYRRRRGAEGIMLKKPVILAQIPENPVPHRSMMGKLKDAVC